MPCLILISSKDIYFRYCLTEAILTNNQNMFLKLSKTIFFWSFAVCLLLYNKASFKWCAIHKKGPYALCGQHRPRSACAFGPLLPAYRINWYFSICPQPENALIRMHKCPRSSGPSLYCLWQKGLFAHCTSHYMPFMLVTAPKNVPYDVCQTRTRINLLINSPISVFVGWSLESQDFYWQTKTNQNNECVY